MGDMWHNVSHTSRTINRPKGIRIGEKNKIFCRFNHGGEREKRKKKEI